MKKRIAVMTAFMVFAMSTTVFGATSPKTSSVTAAETPVESTVPAGTVVTESGINVKLLDVDESSAQNMQSAAEAYVASTFGAGKTAQTLMTKDVVAPEGYVQGTPITFTWNLAGIAAGDTIVVLHYRDGVGMEYVPATAGNGVAIFTLSSLSPVSIVKVVDDALAAEAAGALVLPKMGESASNACLLALALASAGIMAATGRKVRSGQQ